MMIMMDLYNYICKTRLDIVIKYRFPKFPKCIKNLKTHRLYEYQKYSKMFQFMMITIAEMIVTLLCPSWVNHLIVILYFAHILLVTVCVTCE